MRVATPHAKCCFMKGAAGRKGILQFAYAALNIWHWASAWSCLGARRRLLESLRVREPGADRNVVAVADKHSRKMCGPLNLSMEDEQ